MWASPPCCSSSSTGDVSPRVFFAGCCRCLCCSTRPALVAVSLLLGALACPPARLPRLLWSGSPSVNRLSASPRSEEPREAHCWRGVRFPHRVAGGQDDQAASLGHGGSGAVQVSSGGNRGPSALLCSLAAAPGRSPRATTEAPRVSSSCSMSPSKCLANGVLRVWLHPHAHGLTAASPLSGLRRGSGTRRLCVTTTLCCSS